jgi:L-fuconolactonase
MRIDAHQHYWHYDPVRDAWIDDRMAAIRRDFLPEDAAPLLRATEFDGVVAVQADQSEAETDFLLALAARNPLIRGVVGWVNLLAPDLPQRLARWQGAGTLRAFRHIAQAEPDDFLARDDFARGVQCLGEHGYAYDILVFPRQLAAAERLVARCPEVRFVLDHCAKPAIAQREMAPWREGMGRLAAHANVWCKVSGLVTEAAWRNWTDDDLLPYLDVVAELFGPERLLFGSDWPVCVLAADYAEVVGVVERWAGRFEPAEQAALFGKNAVAVYRLEA